MNFHKSSLTGLHVQEDFLQMAMECMNCKLGRLPFLYLGLPVGANLRKVETWKPVNEKFKRKLSTWKARHISLGGRLFS